MKDPSQGVIGRMQDIVYTPIGIIHSPFKDVEGAPIQPSGAWRG